MTASVAPGFGFGIFHTILSPTTIAAQGAGALDSAYTQAGPIPGTPVPTDTASRWRPQIRQAQSQSITVATIWPGSAGRDGAEVLVRLATDSGVTDWRSWQEPNLLTGWSAPSDGWGAASAYDHFAATVITETGLVIVVAFVASSGHGQTWSYDPRTDTWTTLHTWDETSSQGLTGPIGLAYDPSRGRLLLWSGSTTQELAYQSLDGGTTWTRYSNQFGGPGVVDQSFVVVGPSDWLRIGNAQPGSGVTTVTQSASVNAGATWTDTTAPTGGYQGQPCLGPAGYVYVTVDNASSALFAMVSASAFATLTKVVTIAAGPFSAAWCCADADGTIYAFARGTTGASTIDELSAFYSLDGGLTWTAYDIQVWNTGDTTHLFVPFAAVATQGRVLLVGTSIGTAACDNTVQVVSLGGWSQVGQGVGSDLRRTRKARWGYGARIVNHANHEALGYVPPFGLPTTAGWGAVTATGTASLSAATPGLQLVTTAGQGQTYQATAAGSRDFAPLDVDVKLDAAGNVTLATLGTAGGGVFCSVALRKAGGGGYTYAPVVDVGSDGIQVRDGATIRATVSLDMTSQFTRIRIAIRKGAVTVGYSRDYGATWTRLANDVTVTSTGVAPAGDQAFWGNNITQVGKSYWRLVAFATDEDWTYGVDGITTAQLTSANGVRGHVHGRPVPGAGSAYPVPLASAAGEKLPLLTATGGPTYQGELVSLPVAYTYPVDAIHPDQSASPRVPWRSTTTASDQSIVYDQGANKLAWWGGALMLAALRAEFRTAVLELDNGAGAFSAVGTLDKGWSGINYLRVGCAIVPRAGTAELARYYEEGELVGGYVVMSTGGTSVARRILRQSAGYWTTRADVQQIRIELDAIDGSETANGTGEIVHHSGVLVAYVTAETPRRYLRIRIPSGQIVPGGYYSAGILSAGRIVGVGADPSWSYSESMALSRTSTRRTDGVLAYRETGPPRRVVSYSWPDGLDLRLIRTLGEAAGAVATPGGVEIGSREDAWSSPLGLLEHQLRSGEVPCVMLRRLPTATSTITDQRLYTYGVVSADTVTLQGQLGTEGFDEWLSCSGLTIEEVR